VTRKSVDSLDAVEIGMVFEEVFETELPVNDAETLGGPTEIVDWLELCLSNQRPDEEALALLIKLAKARQNPELAEGLEGTWRREQIAAIIREISQVVSSSS
jgi:acyl carrier protein